MTFSLHHTAVWDLACGELMLTQEAALLFVVHGKSLMEGLCILLSVSDLAKKYSNSQTVERLWGNSSFWKLRIGIRCFLFCNNDDDDEDTDNNKNSNSTALIIS